MIVNINGRFVPAEDARVDLGDGALLFGDSLFETLKAAKGRVFFWREHLDRLQLSASLLEIPFDFDAAANALLQTSERLSWPLSRLRLTVSRGPSPALTLPPSDGAWFAITAAEYEEPTDEEHQHGVACCLAPNRRVNPLSHLPQMKRGNYADCLYAARHARSRGCREALFVDSAGRLLEGATSNLFVLRDDTLITPPAGELVLAGIMRRAVIDCAREIGFSVLEENIPLQTVEQCEGAFLSNSLIDLLPIDAIEGRPLTASRLTTQLLNAVRRRAEGQSKFPAGMS